MRTAPYDIVSLTHVIEHLLDPVGVLRRLRQLIAPRGLVFVTAPHRPPGWKRGDGIATWREWSYTHVPAHVQYFSRGSLERAALRAGFEIELWNADQEEGQAFEAWLRPFRFIPLTGPATQESPARGYWEDGWIGSPFEVGVRLERAIESVILCLSLPEHFEHPPELCIQVNGAVLLRRKAKRSSSSVEIRTQAAPGDYLELKITSDRTYNEARAGSGPDERELLIQLKEIRFAGIGESQRGNWFRQMWKLVSGKRNRCA